MQAGANVARQHLLYYAGRLNAAGGSIAESLASKGFQQLYFRPFVELRDP